jgi:hypothetical protein
MRMFKKGHYVRVFTNDFEQEDLGISKMCADCFDNLTGKEKYYYSVWEENLEGDTGVCTICREEVA